MGFGIWRTFTAGLFGICDLQWDRHHAVFDGGIGILEKINKNKGEMRDLAKKIRIAESVFGKKSYSVHILGATF